MSEQSGNNQSQSKAKPQLQDAPPAAKGHEEVQASDSGKPWVLGMVAAVMLAVGLVIGSMLWGAPKLTPFVEPFLQTVSSQQYAKAYGMIAPEWRSVMTQDVFVKLHTEIHKALGDYVSIRQVALERHDDPLLGELAAAHFDTHFTNGDVAITATLRKTADGWSILGVQYDTPLIQGGPPASRKPEAAGNGNKVPDVIHGPQKPAAGQAPANTVPTSKAPATQPQ